jgi:hypothetical protein
MEECGSRYKLPQQSIEIRKVLKNSSQHTQINNQNSNFTSLEHKTEVSMLMMTYLKKTMISK